MEVRARSSTYVRPGCTGVACVAFLVAFLVVELIPVLLVKFSSDSALSQQQEKYDSVDQEDKDGPMRCKCTSSCSVFVYLLLRPVCFS